MFKKITNLKKFINPYLYSNKSNVVRLSTAFFLDILTTTLNIVPIIVAKNIYKNEKRESSSIELTDEDMLIIGILNSSLILSKLLPYFRNRLLAGVRANLQSEIIADMLQKTFELELDDHLSTPTGEFAQLMTTVYTSAADIVPSLFGQLVPANIGLLGLAGGLFYIDWPMGVATISLTVVHILNACYGAKKSGEIREALLVNVYEAYGALLDSIKRYQVAHFFNNVSYEIRMVRHKLDAQAQAYIKSYIQNEVNILRGNLIESIGFTISVLFSLYRFLKGEIEIIDFTLSTYFLMQTGSLLKQNFESIEKLYTASIECNKITEFNEKRSSVADADMAIDLFLNKAPKIEFKNISFSYNNGKENALNDISITFESSKKTAIVGESGSGKSTLIKLLMRFYKPEQGEITINGVNINHLRAESMRSEISIVSQNSDLFNDSLAENIRYGHLSATIEEITAVTQQVELQNYVDTNGLEVNLGEKGEKLSGGQQQRVAIARAILKAGFIFVLDEATSALDIQTEREIMDNLDRLTTGCTVLIVTHRLSSIINVDKIIYMKGGKIIEEGNFKQLMDQQGEFFKQINIECEKLGINPNSINYREEQNRKPNTDFFLKRRKLVSQTNEIPTCIYQI
jgi:ABC-type multidrug transport system fused ATPase/permease subunit